MITIEYCSKCLSVSKCACDALMGDISITNMCPHDVNVMQRHGGYINIPEEEDSLRTAEVRLEMFIPLPFRCVALEYSREDWPPRKYNHLYLVSLNIAKLAWAVGRHDFVTVYRAMRRSELSNIVVADGLSFSPDYVFGKFR